MQEKKQRTRCEVYSRVVGYLRPVQQWNEGKREEFEDRVTFNKQAKPKEQVLKVSA
ncbi:hypothetical protein DRN73_02645 [Candidatus Pacearchaeota archaeon]|nr:MAG: hypothetical protein DRN73_02645 [Candidatus Pacearchaeota archaeon]